MAIEEEVINSNAELPDEQEYLLHNKSELSSNDTNLRKFGSKVLRFLDKTGFTEMRESDNRFENFMQNLSYEDFKSYLIKLNGIVREKAIKDQLIDGNDVSISLDGGIAYLPPEPEKKEEYLNKTFKAIKNITNNKDRATLAYYSLDALHLFADGNGRTSRLIYELLLGNDLSDENIKTLTHHEDINTKVSSKGRQEFEKKLLKPEAAFYLVNRNVAEQELGKEFFDKYGAIMPSMPLNTIASLSADTTKELSGYETSMAEKILSEGDTNNIPFNGIVLAKLIQERPELNKYIFSIQRKFGLDMNGERSIDAIAISTDIGKEIYGIDVLEGLSEDITADEAKRVIDIHKEIKSKFIDTLVGIFTEPEKYKIGNDYYKNAFEI
jgi:hypothetical protein